MLTRRDSMPFALLFLCVLVPNSSLALRAGEAPDASSGETVLEAIAQRGVALREAALVASQYPDLLIRIDRIQLRSSMAFEMRMDRLEPAQQERLWELVGAPGVLEEIVEGGAKDSTALAQIADRTQPPLREAIEALGSQHFELLQEVLAIREAAEFAFSEELDGLPEAVRGSFEVLLQDPPLLSLLARRPSEVVELGRVVAQDPEPVRAQLEELALGGRVAAPDESSVASVEGEETVEIASSTRVVIRENVYFSPRFVGYPYWFGVPRSFVFVDPWFGWTPNIWFYSDAPRYRHLHRSGRHHGRYHSRRGHGVRRAHRAGPATRDRGRVERRERRHRRRSAPDARRGTVEPAGPDRGDAVRPRAGDRRRVERRERRNQRRRAASGRPGTAEPTGDASAAERSSRPPNRPGRQQRAGSTSRQMERREQASGATESRGAERRRARRAKRQRTDDRRMVRRADRPSSRRFEGHSRSNARRAERSGRGGDRRNRGRRR